MSDKLKRKIVKLKSPRNMEYYINLDNDKQRFKFISRCEKTIRSSIEYKDYIQFLKENVGLDSCIFFKGLVKEGEKRGSRISIELHHEPLTLFDIVSIILKKYEEEGLPYNELLIADEIMELHYDGMIGLVPLSKTCHQAVHSGKLSIPLNCVYGKFSDFIEKYEPYIDEDIYAKIERKIKQTNELTKNSFDALVQEFTYYDVEGMEEVDKMDLILKEDNKEKDNTDKIQDIVA